MKFLSHSRHLVTAILLSLGSATSLAQQYDIKVVANVDNPAIKLDKVAVRNLFMGNASDVLLKPVSLPPETLTRAVFNTKIIGLTEARIQSYWSQMRFSGRSREPDQMSTVDELLSFVSSNKGTVAYVPADVEIPPHLTVVYSTDKL
ncbi:hypothetical protein [Alteromonas lipolytica]|uniref:Phosphate ABC transporter substrate-binding protein n=1 Tax=Alteromonas lipolytica TaxID=1856405 RepID=A0A1E8F9Z3_9ALTE|nr:hypothetical protein [Alteromonas lipolytica]OFI32729.1 hypothetical protein BFC17_06140 [Alteromonas lipolytica]GGF73660.1 hypothetical protein GCM10011338_27170 [Alteromonas lipolytica]